LLIKKRDEENRRSQTHTAHRLIFAYLYCNIKSKQILREIWTRFDTINSLVPWPC